MTSDKLKKIMKINLWDELHECLEKSRFDEAYSMIRNFLIYHIEQGNFRSVDPDKMAIHCISTIHGFCLIVIENKLNLLQGQLPDYPHELDFMIAQLIFILQPLAL